MLIATRRTKAESNMPMRIINAPLICSLINARP